MIEQRAKKIVKKDAYMKFYVVAKPLYLDTGTSGISLGARLLQVDGMNCGCDEIPDNAMLCPTAFASKSLLSIEWC